MFDAPLNERTRSRLSRKARRIDAAVEVAEGERLGECFEGDRFVEATNDLETEVAVGSATQGFDVWLTLLDESNELYGSMRPRQTFAKLSNPSCSSELVEAGEEAPANLGDVDCERGWGLSHGDGNRRALREPGTGRVLLEVA